MLIEYFRKGGNIMYVLLAFNIIGYTVILWRFSLLYSYLMQVRKKANEIRVLFANRYPSLSASNIKDIIDFEVSGMETGLVTLKIIASVSTLLGLLGTVIGIYEAFTIVAAKGLASPGAFADGISLALITTIGGLIVAIPNLIAYHYLMGLLDKIQRELERVFIIEGV